MCYGFLKSYEGRIGVFFYLFMIPFSPSVIGIRYFSTQSGWAQSLVVLRFGPKYRLSVSVGLYELSITGASLYFVYFFLVLCFIFQPQTHGAGRDCFYILVSILWLFGLFYCAFSLLSLSCSCYIVYWKVGIVVGNHHFYTILTGGFDAFGCQFLPCIPS